MNYAATAALRIRPVMGVQQTFYQRPVNAVPATPFKIACSNCHLGVMCTPVQLSDRESSRLDELVATRRRVRRGAALFVPGEPFTSLFAIRSGFFKTYIATEDGREQVTGFQMAGEILGLDGIACGSHSCSAIALEDAEVCVMPYERLDEFSREIPALQKHLQKILSREIVREHGVMMMLGSMRAEERLASFLLDIVQRLHMRGFSSSELVLRMTREEIGSYLGLKLETVSRTFSQLAERGILSVRHRHICIRDASALRAIVVSAAH